MYIIKAIKRMAKLEKRPNSPGCEPGIHRFESGISPQTETIGLIPKISVLFLFYRAVSLILGINCLILGEVALFSLPVLKAGNLSKARTSNKKHEMTIKSTNIP